LFQLGKPAGNLIAQYSQAANIVFTKSGILSFTGQYAQRLII